MSLIVFINIIMLYDSNCQCEAIEQGLVCERVGSGVLGKTNFLLLKDNNDGTYKPANGYVKLVCE